MSKTKKPVRKRRQLPPAYLTTRILVRAAEAGFDRAAEETMAVMGHNVIVQDGWVVRIYPDGHTERIEQLPAPEKTSIILD